MPTLYEGENTLNVQLVPVVVLATLSGVVTDADTGSPIQGVTVDVGGIYATSTLSDGSYEITDITPGTYVVTFSHPDYVTQTF